MADQGKTVITMTVPAAGTRGKLVDGSGAFAAVKSAGVMLDDADGATSGPVQTAGTALVSLGATLTAGDLIASDASGDAVAAIDHNVSGVLLEGGASGELRSAIIK